MNDAFIYLFTVCKEGISYGVDDEADLECLFWLLESPYRRNLASKITPTGSYLPCKQYEQIIQYHDLSKEQKIQRKQTSR